MLEEATFAYSSIVKASKKQIQTIEDQGKKQVEPLKALESEENKEDIKPIEWIFPKNMRAHEIKKQK